HIYNFNHDAPSQGINYYRLKQVDNNGKYMYSQIRSVNNSGTFDISIYPNPVNDNLILNFNSEKAMDLQVVISNTEGKIVLSTKLQIEPGSSFKNINANLFGTGSYFIKVSAKDSRTVVLRFVKQ
ncbi:MAG: T9SS type A sorting domain-containing protein, partial [Parafilimonas sp.]